jgi:2-polyprenyl-3-methyl-5-hydroxy-6-metoxy-1,4-benzoquinol methylase
MTQLNGLNSPNSPNSKDNWDQHWQEYNETAEENPAQTYRRELIFSLLGLRGSGEGARVLDIGSGQGDMAAAILARFSSAQVLGLELARSGVEISSRKVPAARFIQRNLLEMREPPDDQRGWATHAVCSEVIEHVDNPFQLLTNARRYMAPGCQLVVTVPGGPMSAFDRHIGHRKHWRAHDLQVVLEQAGYSPTNVTGVGFPFFNLYRCVVILRGKKLITDVRGGSAGASPVARATMALFRQLIRPGLNSSHRGWQIVGKGVV